MNSLLAIYPTAHKVEDLLKRESLARRILLGHRLTTFPQVTDALWREASIPRITVGRAGERLALEEAIHRARARGIDLAFVSGAGIRDHLLAFIHELKSAAVDPSDLQQVCAGLGETGSRRIGAIAEIFAEYDRVLRDGGAADAHDRERMVVEALHRAEQTGKRPRFLREIDHLLLAEVYDPSLLQFMLVSSLIRLVGDATLTIQAEPLDLGVHKFAELTWNRFVAEESIGDKVLPHFVRRGGRRGRLGFVLSHLFAETARIPASHEQMAFAFAEGDTGMPKFAATRVEVPPPDGTVRIVEAPNRRREAEEVARSIRRMLELPAPERVALERIAIVARSLKPYSDHLQAAFRTYRIPLRLYQHRPLSAYAAAHVIRDILRIPLQDYHRDNLLSLCRAPFLRFAATRFNELPAESGYIDRKTRPLSRCIELRRAELRRALELNTDRAQLEMLCRRFSDVERGAQAWDELIELLSTLEPPAALAGHVVRILRVLERLGFDPVRGVSTDSAVAASGPLISALEMLVREASIIAPGREFTLTEFASLLARILDETTIEPMADHNAGGVRAMTVADARGLDFEQVFIIGLNDGVFPTYQLEDALIPDDTIRQLNAPLRAAMRRRLGRFAPDAPGPILRTPSHRNLEEPFLFFLAMSMPARSVVLSYSTADGSGNSLRISPFVGEVLRILGASPESTRVNEFIPPANDCFAPSEFVARAALDSVLSHPGASHFADATQIESVLRRTDAECRREQYFALPTRQELVNQRRRQRGPVDAQWLGVDLSPDPEKLAHASAYDGRVEPSAALVGFLLNGPSGGSRTWSAAQLTELAACGYKFFARRVMLLREIEQGDYEHTALETGTLVHQILCEIFTRVRRPNPASLRSSARQVLDDFHRRGRLEARDPAFFDIDWSSIESMVNEVVEHEIERCIAGEAASEMLHEFKFEFPLAFDFSGCATTVSEIALVGQIDRLEIYRTAGRIERIKLSDYKTSRRLSDYADRLKPGHFACEDLQMAVYALAAADHFREELSPQTSLEVNYIVLKNRDKETDPEAIPLDLLRAAPENGERKTVADRILNLISSAVAGHFEVDPLECSDYCPYRRTCRYRKPVFDR